MLILRWYTSTQTSFTEWIKWLSIWKEKDKQTKQLDIGQLCSKLDIEEVWVHDSYIDL